MPWAAANGKVETSAKTTDGTAKAVSSVTSRAEGLRGLAANLDEMAARFKV
ncbi:MAG: hypothetical protein IPJ21_17290 [Sterolibacteriaceae bacterium]|mgnify:CR=1 FL=1|jgi:methyl-accepting chemotaxis protein|nr:hypothetical protein [Sterolibacteriaceae bacterium]MBK9085525.1 hypothetical protein [Sterolibacteriaceae bacterium]